MDQVPALDNTFGAAYIGVTVAAVLYGVSCCQVFYYFQNHSEDDSRVTKAIVISTLVSDTIHQALISHVVYTYLVTGYFTPQKLSEIVWSLIVEVLFNAITALLVQVFFAVRIWKFSKGNLLVAASLAVLIVGEFVSSLVYVANAISMSTFEQLSGLKALSLTVNALGAAGDILVTVVFCVLLRRARSDLKRSNLNQMVNLLIVFSVQTGMLTSSCAISSLVSMLVSPNTFIYIGFYFLLGRLYCNSLLATLNVRKAIRGRGHWDLDISLLPAEAPNTPYKRQGIDIRVETLRHDTGPDPDGRDGGPPMPKTSPRVVEVEHELEFGQA